jgi:bifunctional non-homologous end joining protein LigD
MLRAIGPDSSGRRRVQFAQAFEYPDPCRVRRGAVPAPAMRDSSRPSSPLRATAPTGDRWVHEIKYDGYRARAHLAGGKAGIFTRNGYGWTKKFAVLAEETS